MEHRSHLLKEEIQNNQTDFLYHYTDTNGVLGILNSKSLWATHYRFLNDLSEGIEAIHIASNQINELNKSNDNNKYVAELLNEMSDLEKLVSHIYVFSFSKDEDSLSQWRAYCPQIGGGYALGLPFNLLKEVAKSENCIFSPCIYGETKKKKIISQIIKSFINDFKFDLKHQNYKKIYNDVPEFITSTAFNFKNYLTKVSLVLKHKGFEQEQEWRLISSLKNSTIIQFRKGKNGLIPYHELKIDTTNDSDFFKKLNNQPKLIVGPSPLENSESLYAGRRLLKKYSGKDSDVEISEIPYKGW